MNLKNKQAFSLLEILISLAILAIFVVGIYGGFNLVLKIVMQSRIKIIESGILNEQIEIIRNMSFYDVGIINGSPSGLLVRNSNLNRNGIDFVITRTIRNIDDPYDSTIDGDPKDLTPADYKLVDLEITCGSACGQKNPLKMISFVAPKFLEGDPTRGALFIQVFDANVLPVQGAEVHIVATSTSSTLDMIDTTDNDGMLRLVDLEQGIFAYNVTVSKDGYTTDRTFRADEIENPTKPPLSVEAQGVTSVSFSIDKVASLDINTINSVCAPVSNVNLTVLGTKLLGIEPNIFKINQNIITNVSGNYLLENLEWDAYGLKTADYDLLGTIPALPVNLLPSINQNVKLILGTNTANSLLISVQDSITNQPISNASVRLSATGYNQNKLTGVGFIRQTDWSGGNGQLIFENENKYWSDDLGIDVLETSGDIKLKKIGENYVSNGQLESSVFDLGTNVNFVNLVWEPLGQPLEVGENSVQFQIATSNTSSPATWEYSGYDGTSSTYYNTENVGINSVHNGNRFLRYKLFLKTDSVSSTPIVSDVLVTYITSCTPPGQVYFANLLNQEYSVEVSASGYQTKNTSVTASGDLIFGINLVSE